MKTKTVFAPGVAVVGIAFAGWLLFQPAAPRPMAQKNLEIISAPAAEKNLAAPAAPTEPGLDPAPVEKVSGLMARALTPPTTNASVASAPGKKPKEPLRDPAARAALGLVGVDIGAEAYWLGAIFDPSLPDQEREDLIEDLNEEGLSDTKRPGPQDLPVILHRLALIEEIASSADDFMLPHLGEAYNDLANLATITQGGGGLVR